MRVSEPANLLSLSISSVGKTNFAMALLPIRLSGVSLLMRKLLALALCVAAPLWCLSQSDENNDCANQPEGTTFLSVWTDTLVTPVISISGDSLGFDTLTVTNFMEEICGCTDSYANNYYPESTADNGLCEYGCDNQPEGTVIESLEYVVIISEDSIINVETVVVTETCGCTDDNATNFYPESTADNGLCEYFDCAGQPEGTSGNVIIQDAYTVVDTSFFVFPDTVIFLIDSIYVPAVSESITCGCTDLYATNYYPESTADNGLCEYFQTSCEFLGDNAWDDYGAGIYGQSPPVHLLGAPDSEELVLHVPEVLTDATTGSPFAVMAWENLTISGMPNGLIFDSFPAVVSGNTQLCVSYSGTPLELGTFEVNVTGEMILDFFGTPYSIGNVSSSLTIVVESNPNPIAGCTYDHAENYMIIANVDDGSCVFAGCTDPNASNFDPTASIDDGSCDDAPCEDGNALNFGDLDSDGIVGTADLLALLGVFGILYD